MTDERDLLEAAARTIDPPHDVMEGLVRRRDRKRRNRRVGSAAVAIVVTAAVAVVLAGVQRRKDAAGEHHGHPPSPEQRPHRVRFPRPKRSQRPHLHRRS